MKKYMDFIIPSVGISINITPIIHFFRDLLFTFIFWQIGYRGFQAAFTTMLVSGIWEASNGVCLNRDGTDGYFDFLDFLPGVFAGFLMVGIMAKSFDFFILLKLLIIYVSAVLIIFIVNKLLGKRFTFKKWNYGKSKELAEP